MNAITTATQKSKEFDKHKTRLKTTLTTAHDHAVDDPAKVDVEYFDVIVSAAEDLAPTERNQNHVLER